MTTRIGFIGAGLMGHGMAKNLVEKGFAVTVLAHRNRRPVEDLVGRGASEAQDLPTLVAASDAVLLCVPSSREVEAVVYGGLLASAREGMLVIDCTTAEPSSTARVAADLHTKGVRFVDAPLTRSPKDAWEGRLNVLVGADEALLEEVRPILRAFSENVFHAGPLGAGHAMKLINNFITQGTAAVIAEAVSTGRKAGVDLDRLFEVVSAGGANSSVFQRMMPWVLGRGESGMVFQLKNAQKDVRYFTHLAEFVGSTAFVGEAVHQSFVLATGQGEGENYVPALARAIGRLNGVRLGPEDG